MPAITAGGGCDLIIVREGCHTLLRFPCVFVVSVRWGALSERAARDQSVCGEPVHDDAAVM